MEKACKRIVLAVGCATIHAPNRGVASNTVSLNDITDISAICVHETDAKGTVAIAIGLPLLRVARRNPQQRPFYQGFPPADVLRRAS